MDFRKLRIAMLLVTAVGANAQFPSDGRNTENAIYFSGEVGLEDGSKPPEAVLIQRVCKGVARDETWTDSKGRFSFKVSTGGNDTSSADSAQATPDKDLSRP